MLPTLLTALLAAAPATGLTLSTQMGKATTPAATYLDAIEQALIAGQLPVRRLPLLCEGRRECLLAGAQNAKLPGIVALTVAYGKKQTTIDLEALRTSDGTTVSQLTFAVTGRLSEADKAKVKAFGEQVAAALTPVVSDAPKVDAPREEPKLTTPVNEPKKIDLALTAKEPKSKVPGWAFAGGALAAGVTSGIFVGLASGTRAQLESTPNPSPLTRVEAEQLAAKANGEYSVALATGLAAGALATAAIIWLVTE